MMKRCIFLTSLSAIATWGALPSQGWAQDEDSSQAPVDENAAASEAAAPDPTSAPSSAPKKSKKAKEEEEEAKAIAEAHADSVPNRKGAWNIGLDARQLNITPDDRRYKQRSIAPDINIGYVYINESWFAMSRAHLVFGPTSQHYPDSPPVDFDGYGISATFGKSLTARELRKPGGDYGVEIGVEAYEIVGRSFRREVLDDQSISSSWVMKNRWTAITPALFATFLKAPRPQGNRPEWLQTRIEGYRISFGVVIPVQSSWDLRWEHDKIGEGDRGKWKGVFGVASLSAWLGI